MRVDKQADTNGTYQKAKTENRQQADFILQDIPSQIQIIRTRPTFRRDPIDDLVRVLDVAGFAMHAVGSIDLQSRAGVVLHHFVNAGRAEADAGIAVFLRALIDTDIGIEHM